MGFGVALGFVLRAALSTDDPFSREDRRALIGQGLAALFSEYLANAPLQLRGKLAATLMLMALEQFITLIRPYEDVPSLRLLLGAIATAIAGPTAAFNSHRPYRPTRFRSIRVQRRPAPCRTADLLAGPR